MASKEILLPWFQNKFEESIRIVNSSNYHIICTDNDNMIFSVNKNKKSYRVDMGNNTCTCFYWQQNGLPCFHATAVILLKQLNAHENFYQNVFEPEAFTSTLVEMFERNNCNGKVPSDDEIRANQNSTNSLKANTTKTFNATTNLRIQSEGKTGGRAIAATTLRKNDRIPCPYCGKHVKGGIHSATVCNKITK